MQKNVTKHPLKTEKNVTTNKRKEDVKMELNNKHDVGLFALIFTLIIAAIVFLNHPPKAGEDFNEEPEITTTFTTTITDITTTNMTTSGTTAVTTTSAITSADTTTETITETTVTEAPQEEQKPETNAPETEAPKQEEPQPEPEPEPEPVKVEPVEEFLIYKPSTYYIHRNTCRWNKGDAYRVDSVEGLEARLCTECNPECEGFTEYVAPVEEPPSSDGLTYVDYFGRVTYYPATAYYDGVCGGSGRTLLGYGDYGNGIRGSIASRSIYETYGYNRNGRTTVYLEFPGYPEMNGTYYCDDCCASYGVIDIFVWSDYSCPFYNAGVITANCYI